MINICKPGLRALGIAESFLKDRDKSILAGVVMRSDFQIDGFSFANITVGGLDATDGVLRIFHSLGRDDINVIFLNGCVISWFNIIDIDEVHNTTRVPLICLTYEESVGLEDYIKEYFDDWGIRVERYKKLGSREKAKLNTGHVVFVRSLGMDDEIVRPLLNKYTIHGKTPEPLRVAQLLARSVFKTLHE